MSAQAPHPQLTVASDASSGTNPLATNSAAASEPAISHSLTPTPTPSQSSQIQPTSAIDMSVIDPVLWPESFRNAATPGILTPQTQNSALTIDPNIPDNAQPPPSATQPSPATTRQRSLDATSSEGIEGSPDSAQPSQLSPIQQQMSDSAGEAIDVSKRKRVPEEKETAIDGGEGVGKENIPPVTTKNPAPSQLSQSRRSSGRQRTAKIMGLPKTIVEIQNSKPTGENGSSSKRAKLS